MVKYVILLFAVFAAQVLSLTEDEEQKQFHTFLDECVHESGVDAAAVNNVRTKGVFSDDPKFKEYLFCFHKKFGIQKPNGELQKDVLKATFIKALNDEAKATEIINKCAVQKATPQDTAFETFKCLELL